MGAWGTGITANDTSADVYADFFELYNDGMPVKAISEKLVRENKELTENPDDSNNFWFALALCQWECKALEHALFEKVKAIIESKNDLAIWKELDALDADIKKRGNDLDKFLAKLQTERKSPKKIKSKKLVDSLFKKGDCLTYKMDNGNYGGAFVLTEEQSSEVGGNFIAITNINQMEKPMVEDFKKSEVYIQRQKDFNLVSGKLKEEWIDVPQIALFVAIEKQNIWIEAIGNLKLYQQYKSRNSYMGLPWNRLLDIVPNKEAHQEQNGIPKTIMKLSKWTKWRWF